MRTHSDTPATPLHGALVYVYYVASCLGFANKPLLSTPYDEIQSVSGLSVPSTEQSGKPVNPGGTQGRKEEKAVSRLSPQPTLPGLALASGLVQISVVKAAKEEKGEA